MTIVKKNKLIIFDFDGIIVDSNVFWKRTIELTIKNLSLSSYQLQSLSGYSFFYGILKVKKFFKIKELLFLFNILKDIISFYDKISVDQRVVHYIESIKNMKHSIYIYSLTPVFIIKKVLRKNHMQTLVNKIISVKKKKPKDFIKMRKNFQKCLYFDDTYLEACKAKGIIDIIFLKGNMNIYHDNKIKQIKEINDVRIK